MGRLLRLGRCQQFCQWIYPRKQWSRPMHDIYARVFSVRNLLMNELEAHANEHVLRLPKL